LFLKVCSYAPWGTKLCLNGHEWAKRQLEKKGIGYEALDNGSFPVPIPKSYSRFATRWGRIREPIGAIVQPRKESAFSAHLLCGTRTIIDVRLPDRIGDNHSQWGRHGEELPPEALILKSSAEKTGSITSDYPDTGGLRLPFAYRG
jgi:hypothetical protein